MAEVGIDISAEQPKLLTTDAVEASDVVITMGCGDACPVFPGKRYLDWQLADPAGQGVDAVRPIRDEIDTRVRDLLAELTADTPRPAPSMTDQEAPTWTPPRSSSEMQRAQADFHQLDRRGHGRRPAAPFPRHPLDQPTAALPHGVRLRHRPDAATARARPRSTRVQPAIRRHPERVPPPLPPDQLPRFVRGRSDPHSAGDGRAARPDRPRTAPQPERGDRRELGPNACTSRPRGTPTSRRP